MNPEWRDLFDETTGEIFDGPADTEREHRKSNSLKSTWMAAFAAMT